jgi:hypothetical protein
MVLTLVPTFSSFAQVSSDDGPNTTDTCWEQALIELIHVGNGIISSAILGWSTVIE